MGIIIAGFATCGKSILGKNIITLKIWNQVHIKI